ncbi:MULTISPECIES: phospholipase effector Tle1 domain-containing protein [Mycobacterium]|uniref:phospholipase effector Tle1 domain-containing protein n=1 Tax=Mycobacterium TaxID=1763 RepID=UPI0013565386|nr:DUF2235 domain-containing protein [Mycobacterium gordonae]
MARCTFTADLPNVAAAKHALDERRCPLATTVSTPRLSRRLVRRLQELWSAGVHGDIGGQNRDRDRPPDIAFSWMAKNAQAAGPAVNAKLYRQRVRVDSTMTSPPTICRGDPSLLPLVAAGSRMAPAPDPARRRVN